MPESPQTPSSRSQPPEDLHWGIVYLREDIQDIKSELRSELRAVHGRIDDTNKRMDVHFRWLMTTLIAVAGIIITVIKI